MSPTFAQLDQQKGISSFPETANEDPSLLEWQRSVYEIPLDKLSTHDIARACRQNIHLNHTIAIALQFLEDNLSEGEMYDSELLMSLIQISPNFWTKHDSLLQPFKLMIQNNKAALPADFVKEARDFLAKISR